MTRKVFTYLIYGTSAIFLIVFTLTNLYSFIIHEYRSLIWQEDVGQVYKVVVSDSSRRSDRYTAYFTYVVDDYEYEGAIYYSYHSYYEDEVISLYYNPKKPWEHTTVNTSTDVKSLMFSIIGGVLVFFEIKGIMKRFSIFSDIEGIKEQIRKRNKENSLDTE